MVGWIPGRDTTRTLVVGAHYDHLGYGGENSLAPDIAPAARRRRRQRLRRRRAARACARCARARPARRRPHNLVFCAFTGEEMGLVGLVHFVDDPTRPLEAVEAMLNMDMVGRLRDNKLMVMGVGTAAEFPALVDEREPGARGFDLKTSSDGYGPSDHSVVLQAEGAGADAVHRRARRLPQAERHLRTRSTARGCARVARVRAATSSSRSTRARAPRTTQAKADSLSAGRIAGGGGLRRLPRHDSGLHADRGRRAALGRARRAARPTVPGLKGGDVIIKFDGVRVDNIYDYTFALRSRKPGQQVRITREARRRAKSTLVATLGRRPVSARPASSGAAAFAASRSRWRLVVARPSGVAGHHAETGNGSPMPPAPPRPTA